jgi:hypothetical protein
MNQTITLSRIEQKLDKIQKDLDKILEDNKKMDSHISFVENVYSTISTPFHKIMNYANTFLPSSSNNKSAISYRQNIEQYKLKYSRE